MAAQQIQFAETIRAMKLALRRHASSDADNASGDSGDDNGARTRTNRGSKLSRRAQYVRAGRLDTTGQQAYKRKIHHAGYERHIISKKPKLHDADGDVLDPQDVGSDVEDDPAYAGTQTLDDDPFGAVQLQHLLRPLTSAAGLPDHPSLSLAYTNGALSDMATEAAEMVRREKVLLWKAKRLLQRFRGDGGWMSSERFGTEQDEMLLRDGDDGDSTGPGVSAVPSVTMDEGAPVLPGAASVERREEEAETHGLAPPDGEDVNGDAMSGIEVQDHGVKAEGTKLPTQEGLAVAREIPAPHDEQEPNIERAHLNLPDIHNDHDSEQDSTSRSGTNAPSHAMTTRARARSPQAPLTTPSPSPSDSASIPPINLWFLPPATALTDRDCGLPAPEAEETRKMLLLYVQKQENVVRNLTSLYDGLQRTDRLRKEIWQACKAEGHLVPDGKGGMQTEMSDGEDWYDPADWNLDASELKDGALEKGKDEVEDAAEEEGRRVGGRRRRVVGR